MGGFHKTAQLIATSFAVVAACSNVASAYRTAADLPEYAGTDRVVWRSDLVSFDVDVNVPPGVVLDDLLAATRAAAAEWNAVACAQIELQADLAEGEAMFADDRNTITVIENWAGRGFDPTAGATADIRFVEDGNGWFIREADIYLNAERLSFGDAESIRSVLLHEMGHALGLLHPCEGDCSAHRQSVLFPDSLGVVTLSEDDEAGACFLYAATPTCPASCPRGELCRDGACVAAESCSSDRQCASGNCVEGRCAAIGPELGDPCATNEDCATGLCADEGYCTRSCGDCPDHWSCEASECVPVRLTHGEECSRADECTSGLCLTGAERARGCTRTCELACPASETCEDVDGRQVCRAPLPSGCSAGGVPLEPTVVLFFLLALRRVR